MVGKVEGEQERREILEVMRENKRLQMLKS